MPEEIKESFCFVALNLRKCSINGDNSVLAYDCRVVTNSHEGAEDTVLVPVLLTDGEGRRRQKVAEAIALHFRDRFNVSGSTVIFG
jgi:hypothetical protein